MPRRFVIDGTNVVLLHGRAYPELRYLLALCDYLSQRGNDVSCFFDANTRYVLAEHRPDQLDAFTYITQPAPLAARFEVVPGKTEADEWILAAAKKSGADVISNDRFKSRSRKNPWIYKRRHGLTVRDSVLHLPGLAAEIPVLPRAEDYLPLAH